jgi:hypothetical protein
MNNRIADFVAKSIITSHKLGLVVAVEQPLSSILPEHPAVRDALLQTGCQKYVFRLGNFGCSSPKPLQLWTTAPWAENLQALALEARAQPTFCEPTMTLATRRNGRVTGRREELAESAAYPLFFCECIAMLHKRFMDDLNPTRVTIKQIEAATASRKRSAAGELKC